MGPLSKDTSLSPSPPPPLPPPPSPCGAQGRDDYSIWSLFLIFVGVTLPELAFKPDSTFLPSFEGHENNIHCLAIAVNALAGAIFLSYGKDHQRDRMKEFLVVSGTGMRGRGLIGHTYQCYIHSVVTHTVYLSLYTMSASSI